MIAAQGDTEMNDPLRKALLACVELFDHALPKFNWGASALDARAIKLLNEVPLTVRAALERKPLEELTDEQIMDLCRDLAADGGRWPSAWIAACRAAIAAAPRPKPIKFNIVDPMTAEWCKTFPKASAFIINRLAEQVDALHRETADVQEH